MLKLSPNGTSTTRVIADFKELQRNTGLVCHQSSQERRRCVGSVTLIGIDLDDRPGVHQRLVVVLVFAFVVWVELHIKREDP